MKKGRVKIEKIVHRGLGLGRTEAGKVVLIPFSLPEEEVEYRAIEEHNSYILGELIDVLIPSSSRELPRCPLYMKCGGCHFQHMVYNVQLELKQKIAKEIWHGKEHIDVRGYPGQIWFYRRRARFHVDMDKGLVGFRGLYTKDIVDIERCFICNAKINELLQWIRNELLDYMRYLQVELTSVTITIGDKECLLLYNTNNIVENSKKDAVRKFGCDRGIIEFSDDDNHNTITLAVGGFKYLVNAVSFVQSNPWVVEKLFNEPMLKINSGSRVLELFCGWGMMSFFLARRAQYIEGVELASSSKFLFAQNAINNGISNFKYRAMRVEDYLQKYRNILDKFDILFLDPPRIGLKRSARRILKQVPFKHILYLSCEAQTQFRDINEIMGNYYDLGGITIYDWFPQTFHFETLVRLNGIKKR